MKRLGVLGIGVAVALGTYMVLSPLGSSSVRFGAPGASIDAETLRTIMATLAGVLVPYLAKTWPDWLAFIRQILGAQSDEVAVRLDRIEAKLDEALKK